jgi:hypothetical protein
MDLTKVNPILGYEMYSSRDRAAINRRTGDHVNRLTEQVQSLIK